MSHEASADPDGLVKEEIASCGAQNALVEDWQMQLIEQKG